MDKLELFHACQMALAQQPGAHTENVSAHVQGVLAFTMHVSGVNVEYSLSLHMPGSRAAVRFCIESQH